MVGGRWGRVVRRELAAKEPNALHGQRRQALRAVEHEKQQGKKLAFQIDSKKRILEDMSVAEQACLGDYKSGYTGGENHCSSNGTSLFWTLLQSKTKLNVCSRIDLCVQTHDVPATRLPVTTKRNTS